MYFVVHAAASSSSSDMTMTITISNVNLVWTRMTQIRPKMAQIFRDCHAPQLLDRVDGVSRLFRIRSRNCAATILERYSLVEELYQDSADILLHSFDTVFIGLD